MTATLRLITQLIAFGDESVSNNPRLKHVDWSRDLPQLSVANPSSVGYTIAAGQTKLLFDGSRALTAAEDTEMALELVSGSADTYRFRWTDGPDPTFRTDRDIDWQNATVNVAVNLNGTACWTTDGATTNIVVGDVLWVPDENEIDSQVFHSGNQGFWTVLAVSEGRIVLAREGDFEAYGETGVTVTSADQVQVYSSAGVQAGDKVEVTAGFVVSNQKTFSIVNVTSLYLEVQSSLALAEEDGVFPGVDGLLIYSSSKKFLYVEADQECAIQINGDTSSFQRVSPWVAGDTKNAGSYSRSGPTWSLSVVNRSSRTLNAVVISAE